MDNDTLDKIDQAIKKLNSSEVNTETEFKYDTDTKIFNGDISNDNDLEKTMEFDGILKEVVVCSDTKKNNSDSLVILLYVIALVITVILVTGFILFLY